MGARVKLVFVGVMWIQRVGGAKGCMHSGARVEKVRGS